MKEKSKRYFGIAILVLLLGVVLAACSTSGGSEPAAEEAEAEAEVEEAEAESEEAMVAGTDGTAVGFLFVGPGDDFGYNQAAYMGSEAVESALADMEVLRAENVPENQEAERVMENMIRNGAKIIFPTSYGHLDPALAVAERYPDVIFMHQGGLKTADNLGTYFGTIWETMYLSGVAAGHMSETG